MNVYTRPRKDAIRVGDTARVASAPLVIGLEGAGAVTVKDRGWSGARVLRFIEGRRGTLAEVTVPGRAATRTIAADRLTRTRSTK